MRPPLPVRKRYMNIGRLMAGHMPDRLHDVEPITSNEHVPDESAGDGTEPTAGTIFLASADGRTITPVERHSIPYPF